MKNATRFGKLVKDLSRDPRMKKAVAKATRQSRDPGIKKVEDVTGIAVLLMKIASSFAKKKKSRAIDEAMDMIYLLVQVSIVLKENIFDRPEVKKFFNESFRQIYGAAEEFVAMVLPKKAKAISAQAEGPLRAKAISAQAEGPLRAKAISAQAEGPLCAKAKGARPRRAVRPA